jgi:hypothetical protein
VKALSREAKDRFVLLLSRYLKCYLQTYKQRISPPAGAGGEGKDQPLEERKHTRELAKASARIAAAQDSSLRPCPKTFTRRHSGRKTQ